MTTATTTGTAVSDDQLDELLARATRIETVATHLGTILHRRITRLRTALIVGMVGCAVAVAALAAVAWHATTQTDQQRETVERGYARDCAYLAVVSRYSSSPEIRRAAGVRADQLACPP